MLSRSVWNPALNILSCTRQTQTHICVIWDGDITRCMDFPSPITPQYTQILLEMQWRPCPIIHLELKCGAVTWDFCCRLPEAQHYRTWHWANTWDEHYQCNDLFMGWYYENKAYQMKTDCGNEVQAPFQSIHVNILGRLNSKTVRELQEKINFIN